MFTRRLAHRIVLTIIALGPGALAASADSASAPLAVTVMVVRSCSITAMPAAHGLANVVLQCTAGAASGLQTPRSANLPTEPFRGSPAGNGWQVVTLNF